MRKYLLAFILICCIGIGLKADAGLVPWLVGGSGCVGGADGAIGSSDNQGQDFVSLLTDGDCFYSEYTPAEDGTVTYIHIVVSYNNENSINAAIWAADGSRLMDSTAVVSGTNDNDHQIDFQLDSAYCLVTGTTYRIGWVINGADTAFYVDRNSDSGTVYKCSGVTSGNTVGDLCGEPDTVSTSGRIIVWADNSAS